MKRLDIEDNEIMQIAIQQEILRSEDSRYDHKLHGVLIVSKGYSCSEVGELFGHDATTVQRWVNRFNQKGFAGLYEGERTGRPKKIDPKAWEQLGRDLRKNPREFEYAQNMWDGKLLSHHLEQQYGIKLGVRQCQRIFNKMEFRRRKPRPVIANADPDAQAAFKKNSPNGTRSKH
jgi:transposase